MKKMIAGLLLLIILFVSTLVNSISLENALITVYEKIDESYYLSNSELMICLEDGLIRWESLSGYANIVLCDAAFEKVTGAFYECLKDPSDLLMRDKLMKDIIDLIESEKISFASIF